MFTILGLEYNVALKVSIEQLHVRNGNNRLERAFQMSFLCVIEKNIMYWTFMIGAFGISPE